MFKLLVNTPDGRQDIVLIAKSGSFVEAETRVLWDERKDGPLPGNVKVGGMVREGAALRLDAGLLAIHEEVKAQEESQPKPPTTEHRVAALEKAVAELKAGK